MPYRFPYSAETEAMPEGRDKYHARARERALRYRQADYEPRRQRAVNNAPAHGAVAVAFQHVPDLIAINNPLPVAPVAPAVRPIKPIATHVRTMMLELATAKNEQWECPICRSDEIPNGDYIVTHCGHHFCQPCLDAWLGQRHATRQCPTCRERLD